MAVGRRSVRHTRPSGVPGVPRSHGTPEPRRGTSPLTFGTSTPAQPAGHVEEDRVSELTPRYVFPFMSETSNGLSLNIMVV